MARGDDIFGFILAGGEVETAVAQMLGKWMDTYLREVESQLGIQLGIIPLPRSYTTRNTFDTFPEDQLPLIVVVSPGLVPGSPRKEGDGTYRATWRVGAGVVASAKTAEDVGNLVKVYAAATRAILLQESLETIEGRVSAWTDESYDDVPVPERDRNVMASQIIVHVDVDNVVNRSKGPTTPTSPFGEQLPDPALVGTLPHTAETVTVSIVRKEEQP